MVISFERVNPSNLSEYASLENSALIYFISRTRPYNYHEKTESTLFWKYICLNNERIGAVWLEKENEKSEVVILGIFIAKDENTCKGIGQTAIENAIEQASCEMCFTRIELHVRGNNPRAIACYKKCGFIETNRFFGERTGKQVEAVTMIVDKI